MTYYRYRFSFGYGLTPIVKKLMILMGIIFLLQIVVSRWMTFYLGLVPLLVWKKYFLWQLFTYIFLHGGVTHLLFNLLALWMFGGELENYWGSKKFLFYFLFCGIGAGLLTILFSPSQIIPVIGASGAIYGILLAFGWLFPNRPIFIYFLFPIPAKYMVILYGLIELFSSLEGTGGGIAHLTHLGGLLFGLLYMSYPLVRQTIRREYYRRKWSQRS
ncbi:MAG: rhomboid family intramembrane serine protease [Thermodesulfobacteriota bacterium]